MIFRAKFISGPILLCFLTLLLHSCAGDPFPIISIYHDGPISWEEKERCETTYTVNGISENHSARIKCRGGISSRYHKHSYSIEFDSDIAFGNIEADDDWVLNANYIDKTFMRHKISYDLFRQMAERNLAPESFYLNLYLNDKPMGLYLAMQEVNAGMAGLDRSDTMAMLFKDPPVYFEQELAYVQDPDNYYHQKFPDIEAADKSWYIKEFKDFIFNSADQDFLADLASWIDVQNLIDWHLLLLFTNNGDGVMKNFVLYKINSHTPLRIALWDYDHSFGRDGDYELNMMRSEVDPSRSILLKRLMTMPGSDYPELLRERWWELRESGILSSENIERLLKKNDKIIREQIPLNAERWPLDSKWYEDDNSYQEELELISDFLALRIPQLDDYFTRLQSEN